MTVDWTDSPLIPEWTIDISIRNGFALELIKYSVKQMQYDYNLDRIYTD